MPGFSFNFLFGELHQMLPLLPHILLHPAIEAAAVGPGMCQRDGQRDGLPKAASEKATVEYLAQQVKGSGIISQSVAVGKEKTLAIDIGDQRFKVKNQATLHREVIGEPDIVIADEEVNLHSPNRSAPQASPAGGCIPFGTT